MSGCHTDLRYIEQQRLTNPVKLEETDCAVPVEGTQDVGFSTGIGRRTDQFWRGHATRLTHTDKQRHRAGRRVTCDAQSHQMLISSQSIGSPLS